MGLAGLARRTAVRALRSRAARRLRFQRDRQGPDRPIGLRSAFGAVAPRRPKDGHGPVSIGQKVDTRITELTNAVASMQQGVRVLALGIDYPRYGRFRRLTPRVYGTQEHRQVQLENGYASARTGTSSPTSAWRPAVRDTGARGPSDDCRLRRDRGQSGRAGAPVRNVLPVKIDAVSYGVSVMHGEMSEQFGDMRERLGRIELGQERQADQLAEILRRLPGGTIIGPARGQDDH